jgi:hypothetical protein
MSKINPKLVSRINKNLDNVFDKISRKESILNNKLIKIDYYFYNILKNKISINDTSNESSLYQKQLTLLYNRRKIVKREIINCYIKMNKIVKIINKFNKKVFGV